MLERRFFTDEEIETFKRDGFLVVRGLFDEKETRDIVRWTHEVENLPEVPGKYMMYFEQSKIDPQKRIIQRIENFSPYHDGFRRLFHSEKLRGRVSELFGEPAVLFKEKINFKLPGGDGFKPHQDQQAGWWEYADLFVSVLVCVDEATVENGCLEISPGTFDHLVGKEWTPLTEEDMATMNFSPFPTKPGDVVFFDCYVPHGSKPNLSDKPRRLLFITYNRKSDGDHRVRYYADKRKSFPPDCEREPGKEYVFRV